MKKLLDHITNDSPIYAYDQDFENTPVLLHQIKVIQAPEGKKTEEAAYQWEQLKSIAPDTYKDNFQYNSTRCLFSLCLDKHKQNDVSSTHFNVSDSLPKLEALEAMLKQSKCPLPAGLIFEVIWGHAPEDKHDLRKVSNLISRLKIEKKLDIVFRKGTYELKCKASQKAS